MCFIYAQLSGLLPRLELQSEWAGANGDSGLPASMWSAVMSLRSVKGCLQRWQWVAVARRYALALR
jgi:hypothetical protein